MWGGWAMMGMGFSSAVPLPCRLTSASRIMESTRKYGHKFCIYGAKHFTLYENLCFFFPAIIKPPKQVLCASRCVCELTGKSCIHLLFAVGSVKPGGEQTIGLADLTDLDQVVQHVSISRKDWRRTYGRWLESHKQTDTLLKECTALAKHITVTAGTFFFYNLAPPLFYSIWLLHSLSNILAF